MSSFMVFHVTLGRGVMITKLALKWFISSVHSKMVYQIKFSRKKFITKLAFKNPNFSDLNRFYITFGFDHVD